MSHLGPRITALVDGELPPDVAERAYAHAALCEQCREAVEGERASRSLLRAAAEPAMSADLMTSLLAMGGPAGPLPPRPGHLPGTPRPEPLSLPRRPGRRPATTGFTSPGFMSTGLMSTGPGRGGRLLVRAGVRPARRLRRRLAVALLGSVSLASAGVLGLVVVNGLLTDSGQGAPATTQLVVDRGTTVGQRLVLPAAEITSGVPAVGASSPTGSPSP